MNAKIVLWGGGERQSWQQEALMIAATAGIATAVGAMAGGKKGATFGAISGGVTPVPHAHAELNIRFVATKRHKRGQERSSCTFCAFLWLFLFFTKG